MKTNNKALTYILIAVVGFIWFKVFVRLKDNSAIDAAPYVSSSAGFTGKISKPVSFKLNAKYADPFHIRKAAVVSDASLNPAFSQQPKPIKEKPAPKIVYWPSIVYYGFVKNNNAGKTPRALVAIDGSIYKLRKGEVFLDGFELKGLSREELALRYKGEVKTFRKVE